MVLSSAKAEGSSRPARPADGCDTKNGRRDGSWYKAAADCIDFFVEPKIKGGNHEIHQFVKSYCDNDRQPYENHVCLVSLSVVLMM